MANSSLRFFLGFYPKTDEIEKKRSALIKEFEELNAFAKSDELARYEYLTKFVNSPEFAVRKKYLETLSYKESEEKKKEDAYLSAKKTNEIRFFYKFGASSAYKQYLSLEGSTEINQFEKLKAFVASAEFKKVEDYMNDKKKWEKTEEYRKEQEYKLMVKDTAYKTYFKFLASKEYRKYSALSVPEEVTAFEAKHPYIASFKKMHNSTQLKHYTELEQFIKSPAFASKKQEIASLRFNKTDEYQKLTEYKKLASSSKIKDFYKMKASKELAEYRRIEASNIVTNYEKLQQEVLSDNFKNRKAYLLDSKKWIKSDEFKQNQELNQLKKAPKIKWYFKLKDNPKYNDLRQWKIAFDEEFTSNSLDRTKWLTRYYWGDALLNDTYALPGEKHLFTDAKNVEYNASTIKLVTRNEKSKGKEWVPALGFIPKEFDYTSALLSSGKSFRTKYGRIEAKIKIDSTDGVFHAFWLSGSTIFPQLDIFKFYNNKLHFSSFSGNVTQPDAVKTDSLALKGTNFVGKFFIYSLEWTPEKLIWRINNLEVKTQVNNIPDESMYFTLNSGVLGDKPGSMPASMEIDWVRCYQKN